MRITSPVYFDILPLIDDIKSFEYIAYNAAIFMYVEGSHFRDNLDITTDTCSEPINSTRDHAPLLCTHCTRPELVAKFTV